MSHKKSIMSLLLHCLLLVSLICSVSYSKIIGHQLSNQTFRLENGIRYWKKINNINLQQINKPAIKTIQSPDGDIIDCVLIDKQPAFDHPLLKRQKPLDPPELPKGYNQTSVISDKFQLWHLSNESCPNGTIPIRRTKKEEILNVDLNQVKMDATNPNGHVYSIERVTGQEYYGAEATLNVWVPHVENGGEFSLSQIWVIAGTQKDLNTVEAGWQVYPQKYGNNRPRLFIYWTADSYKRTGCYNLQCSGFVQTHKEIVLGGAISPTSTYNGPQFDIPLLIFKDPKSENWWLVFAGKAIGYWPSSLFPILKNHATRIEFGGEVVDTRLKGSHTTTQMGSGHFAEEGFGKASYIKDMLVVNYDNNLIPLSNPQFIIDQPNCYNIQARNNNQLGNHFFFGGPGKNPKCT